MRPCRTGTSSATRSLRLLLQQRDRIGPVGSRHPLSVARSGSVDAGALPARDPLRGRERLTAGPPGPPHRRRAVLTGIRSPQRCSRSRGTIRLDAPNPVVESRVPVEAAEPRPAARSDGERLGGYIYGTIVVLATVVAGREGVPGRTSATSRLLVLITTVVFWLAHVYAHALAHSVARGRAPVARDAARRSHTARARSSRRRSLPSSRSLLGHCGVVSEHTAVWLAVACGFGVLVAQGFAFARAERLGRLATLAIVGLNLGLGLALVGPEALGRRTATSAGALFGSARRTARSAAARRRTPRTRPRTPTRTARRRPGSASASRRRTAGTPPAARSPSPRSSAARTRSRGRRRPSRRAPSGAPRAASPRPCPRVQACTRGCRRSVEFRLVAIAREAGPVGVADRGERGGPRPRRPPDDLQNMLITRGIEERGHILYKQGKIPGSFYTGRGNEGAAVGDRDRDGAGRRRRAAPPRHGRPHHARRSSRGGSSPSTWAAPTGRRAARTATSTSATCGSGTIAMVSHLPAMLPVAVGCALAFRIREEPRVAVGWFGEGASARGDTHEAMNLAGVQRLPVVFICDNNQWAYSTPSYLEFATEHIADRAERVRLRGRGRRRHRRARRLPRGQARDREGARRRRADADRVHDACAWRATPSTTTRSTSPRSCSRSGPRATRSSASAPG